MGDAVCRAELVDEMPAIDKAFPQLRFQKRTAALLNTGGSAEEEGILAQTDRWTS